MRNFPEALKYFNLASQSGHMLGLYYLGLMNIHGAGTPGGYKFCNQGTLLLKRVAERRQSAQTFEEAYEAYREGNFELATMKYLLLAEQGFELAQVNAAFLLDAGHLVKNQTEREWLALNNWIRASSQGSIDATVQVGDFYYYGKGVEVDFTKAAARYATAKQGSSAQAMFNLGFMREHGLGVTKVWRSFLFHSL